MGQGAFMALSGSTNLHDSLIYFKKSLALAKNGPVCWVFEGMGLDDMRT
jgi:hypothetical protein